MKHTDSANSQSSKRRSLSDQLHQDSRQAARLPRRFRRLYAAIEAEQLNEAGLTCDGAQSMLDVYVADDLAGANVRQQYPDVWQHLQTCSNCRPDYDALIDALRNVDDRSIDPAFTPAFLRRPSEQEPWIKRVRSHLSGLAWGLEFIFDPKYLRERLWPSSAAPQLRSGDTPGRSDAERVLLIDRVALDDQQVLIELKVAQSSEQTDRLTLSAELTSSGTLPDRLVSKITLAGQLYAAPFNADGRAVIENIPLTQLREVLIEGQDSFRIAIEVRADDDVPTAE